jgi:hypothetical protein
VIKFTQGMMLTTAFTREDGLGRSESSESSISFIERLERKKHSSHELLILFLASNSNQAKI